MTIEYAFNVLDILSSHPVSTIWPTMVGLGEKISKLRLTDGCSTLSQDLLFQIRCFIDAHSLPRVDDLLDALSGSRYFCALDLRAGYWQLSVVPEDREKTAFVTPDGLWEFIGLPFGVSHGPATFQRAIEIILSGLTYHTCLCYFGDIIIPSDSILQQCERLSAVLSRFQKHYLRVKASKCCFGVSKVPFLEHVASGKGVHTDPKTIEAVSNLPPPTNLDQVRFFLGLAEYYRRCIRNFPHISSLLVTLTKKSSKFS